jgi:hypothetical protein
MSIKKLKKEILDFFKDLEFDATKHEYKVNGKSISSVSHFYKKFSEPFDADKMATFVARKRGISKEEVLAEWASKRDMAAEKGTRVHLFGELYKKDSVPSDGLEEAIVKYWKDMPRHIKPVVSELRMFSEWYGIAGTLDTLLYDRKDKSFIIDDYKSNIDLHKNYKGKKLLFPFNNMLDTPLNRYKIQLNLYKMLFEQCGYKVSKKRIIWIKPDSTYEVFEVEDLTDRLKIQLYGG